MDEQDLDVRAVLADLFRVAESASAFSKSMSALSLSLLEVSRSIASSFKIDHRSAHQKAQDLERSVDR